MATGSSTVDLSRLPPPTIIEQVDFATIRDAILAALVTRVPAMAGLLPADPAYKIIEVAAFRETLIRQDFNDRARQLMVAYATGPNLDHHAALLGVTRLVLSPATDIAPAVLEGDDALRERLVLAPESFTTAGPELAYVYHAKSAAPGVLDARATSPAPGEVLVSVLSRDGDGAASPALLDSVAAVVTRPDIRPLGDRVTVASAEIIPFEIRATVTTFDGPDSALVIATARQQLVAWLAEQRRIGRDIPRSGIFARLSPDGVQRVDLVSPAADIVCGDIQAAHCTAIHLTHGGFGD